MHKHCICGDGVCAVAGHSHAELTWTAWTSTTTLPDTAGNWYLANDVTLSAAYAPPTGVNLCLNGHVVKQGGSVNVVTVSANVAFTLTDCGTTKHYFTVGDGGLWTLNTSATSGTDYDTLTARPTAGTVVAVKGGAITGGTGVNCGGNYASGGGVLVNGGGGVFTMFGGNVVGNSADFFGGGVSVGVDVTGTAKINGGRIIGNTSLCGGGVHGHTMATLEISGGDVSFNYAGNHGGGVMPYASFTMRGGLVRYNRAKTYYGGGIAMQQGTASILGGGVVGNVADSGPGGGIYVQGGSLTLGGSACITNNTANGASDNLYLLASQTFSVSSETPLAADASVGVKTATAPAASSPVAISSNGAAADAAHFTSDAGYVVTYASGHLALAVAVTFTPTAVDHATASVYVDDVAVAKTGDVYKLPKGATAKVVYAAGSGYCFAGGVTAVTNAIDTSTDPATADAPTKIFVECATWADVKTNLLAGNNVLLTADVSITDQNDALAVNGEVTSGKTYDVTFDLNGHTVDAYSGGNTAGEKDRVFILNGSAADYALTICDSAGGGAFVGHKQVVGHAGGFAFVADNCKLTLNGGTIRGFSSSSNGGAIALYATGTFEMNGGTITNCTAGGSGGAIYNQQGKVTLNGGAIVGYAGKTGVVALNNSVSFVISGGVYDTDPGVSASGATWPSGYSSTQVGSLWVVGKDVTQADGALTGGTFNFDPTADEYAAAGLKVGSQFAAAANGTDPETWTVALPIPSYDYTLILLGGQAYTNRVDADHTFDASSLGLSFADGVWTMQDFKFASTENSPYDDVDGYEGKAIAILVKGDATFNVLGDNVVRAGSCPSSYGMLFVKSSSPATVTFTGTGTLTVLGGEATGNNSNRSCGMEARNTNLKFDGSLAVVARGGTANTDSYGLFAIPSYGDGVAKETITVNDATLTASAGTGGGDTIGLYYGNERDGQIVVTGAGKLAASGATRAVGVAYYEPWAVARDTQTDALLVWQSSNYKDQYDGNVATAVTLTAKAPIQCPAPVYVGNVASNGIAEWVTTNVSLGYHVVESSDSRLTWGKNGKTYWYAVTNDVTIKGGVECLGDVNLVLCDGAKLMIGVDMASNVGTANYNAGIATAADGSFTIYETVPGDAASPSRKIGQLVVAGGAYGAGIGGNNGYSGKNITINGGTVTAQGGHEGAGIGGGGNSDWDNPSPGFGSNITINGGTVTATGGGGNGGAGIGGGANYGAGSAITINGGTVTATGGGYAAGIGGGYMGNGVGIVVNGGTVKATVGGDAAAVGGGVSGQGSNLAIGGGTVYVASQNAAVALIGSGKDGAAASGVTFADAAKVMFDVTSGGQGLSAQPEFEGFAILTPETPVARTLAGGVDGDSVGGGTPTLPWVITNAVTHATNGITVGGSVEIADKRLTLALAEGTLALTVEGRVTLPAPAVLDNVASTTVYTNDAPAEIGESGLAVWKDTDAYVVYVAETGCFFWDGSTVYTNRYDMSQDEPRLYWVSSPMPPVTYRWPEYNQEGVPASGVKAWHDGVVTNYNALVNYDEDMYEYYMSRYRERDELYDGWYVVTSNVTIYGGLDLDGDVHLILCDGAKLTITNVASYGAGIATDSEGSFSIYGQAGNTGVLDVVGGYRGAGISAVRYDSSSGSYESEESLRDVGPNTGDAVVTINGGVVTAEGGTSAAGIGGGCGGSGSGIVVNGGTVTALGGESDDYNPGAAGIGGGAYGSGSSIVFNGGTVTALGGDYGAGIGGSYNSSGKSITINNGTVTATGGDYAAGIGGGYRGSGESITIDNGTVAATGGYYAAGIGGGYHGSGESITINNGTVTATGGYEGAGIGGGYDYNGESITINGGTVTAEGLYGGAGIGGGYYGSVESITINGGTILVGAVVQYYEGYPYCGAYIGGGIFGSASGTQISSEAKVLFNLTGSYDYDTGAETPIAEMPETFDGFTVMTPATQTLDRVLVGGYSVGGGTPTLPWVLTNAVTGATGEIAVNAEAHTPFASTLLRLAGDEDAGTLTLKLDAPTTRFVQMPYVTNDYVAVAETDAPGGIVNYAWGSESQTVTGFEELMDAGNLGEGTRNGDAVTSDGYSYHYVAIAWSASAISPESVFRFYCTGNVELSSSQYGSLTSVGNGWWTFVPALVEDSSYGDYYALCLRGEDSFEISNLTCSVPGFEVVAEGADLTAFPVEKGEFGSNYVCRVSCVSGGKTYTLDSAPFAYVGVMTLAQPPVVAGATAQVYTNGVLSAETESGSGLWNTWSNGTAKVVYTADDGTYFENGEVTCEIPLDTSADPALPVVQPVAPAAPSVKVANKPLQRYPWNGVVDVPYRVKNWPVNASGWAIRFKIRVGEEGDWVNAGSAWPDGAGTVRGSVEIDLKKLDLPTDRGKAKVMAEIQMAE